eukprot:334031-Amphidinium_carterae.1
MVAGAGRGPGGGWHHLQGHGPPKPAHKRTTTSVSTSLSVGYLCKHAAFLCPGYIRSRTLAQ